MKSLVLVLAILAGAEHAAAAGVNTGDVAPPFSLSTYDGNKVSLADYSENVVVLEWFAHDCPFVSDHYKGDDAHMPKLQKELTAQGAIWLAIDSNRTALAGEEMLAHAKKWNLNATALLSDPTGAVGKQYGATNTPQMFVIDKGTVVYRGAIDDSRFGFFRDRSKVLNYVRQAFGELLAGKPVSVRETKPYGCSVKYAD